ncbi:hypothetical protein EDC54_10360 [Samsonia erythrinae]|uniref:Uncharacterized protein n=1 Tax=Samsonia erythrinae TaxID=160434 RepID=A0A4R3VKN2_9GAMM|nr:hypothetical protein EDC54_10360 [Samsonia erythrinae]
MDITSGSELPDHRLKQGYAFRKVALGAIDDDNIRDWRQAR